MIMLKRLFTPPFKGEDTFVKYILFYQKMYRMGFKRFGKALYWLYRIIFGVDIPCTVKIGTNLCLPHFGLGVVIHPYAVIGNNVKIYQQVTIGARGKNWYAVIEDGVLLGAGCKILGSIKIGKNSKIGANAVVLSDVPDEATAVGIPAKIINKKK